LLSAWGSDATYTYPHLFALVARDQATAALDVKFGIVPAPMPGEVKTVTMNYRRRKIALTNDGDYPIGGQHHGASLMAFVLAAVERHGKREEGIWARQAERRLADAIRTDNLNRPLNLGSIGGDRPMPNVPYWTPPVTYS
jgi:hypothetical protein